VAAQLLELSGNRTKNPQKLYPVSVSVDPRKNLCKPYVASVSAIFLVITRQVYYEHVIRDDRALHQIQQYIQNNPLSWQQDQLHPSNSSKW
jgi:hypothetical protein